MQGVIPAVVAATLLTAAAVSTAALAEECPGNPDAIGTSRTIVVDALEHPRLGGMQYRESLPLEDKEVVLTFDDGPLPPKSNHVLDILAKECVKATFFLVGKMATTYPDVVHKIEAAGHTIGTHSQTHPLRLHKVALAKAEEEFNGGIASVTSVLGHPPAPFIRIPGLARTNAIDQYLASQKLMTWSADFPADDWTKISPTQVYTRALQRIEAYGKGILLLHDIQPRTVEALPTLLHELKRRGYRIVHVVPATPEQPKTATLPSEWVVHAHMHQIWPASFAEIDETILATVLPAPSPANFGATHPFDPLATAKRTKPTVATAAPAGKTAHGRNKFRPAQSAQLPAAQLPPAPWPRAFSESQATLVHVALPAPSPDSFSYPETSPTPWLPGRVSMVVPPVPVPSAAPDSDAMAMLIRRSLQDLQEPAEPAEPVVPPMPPSRRLGPASTGR
jgi:peptidoglycan/xylan/chitin deacetylase (PgdA/CDA1 family)